MIDCMEWIREIRRPRLCSCMRAAHMCVCVCVCVCENSHTLSCTCSFVCMQPCVGGLCMQHSFEMRGNASRDERLWAARMHGALSSGTATSNSASHVLSNGNGSGWSGRQHVQQQQQQIQQGWFGHEYFGSHPMQDEDAERSTIDMYEDVLAERSTEMAFDPIANDFPSASIPACCVILEALRDTCILIV